ncbi:MAG: hypothetical protein JO316_26280 [Abitibacteriaceae bacterium]|nr:hypothetical protein [Abditibacteriaceae bacterium]
MLQRPHTIRQAILQAIRLSSGQGLFVIPDLETYAPIAIAGSRRPNGSLLVEFRLGGWRWEHRVKEKLFEVRFRRTGVSLTSFRRIKPPSAPEANRCKAIAVACAYSFSHDLKKVGLKLGNRFQIEPQKTNADGFHMTIDTNYPATTGDCFDIGVSYNFRVLYLNPTS